MPRASVLYSQTNMQSRHILLQLSLSQSSTDNTKFHVLILLCHVFPNPLLRHFFSTFSSSYILIHSSSIKFLTDCFSSSKFSNTVTFFKFHLHPFCVQ